MWPFQYLGIVLQEARRDGSTTWSCLAQPTAASSGVHVVEPRTAQSHQLDPSPCQQFQTRPVQLVINKCANRAGIPRRGGGVFRQTERENIDVARKLKLTVTRVPIYSPHAVAEHAVALLLTLNRKIHRARSAMARMAQRVVRSYFLFGR